MKGITKPAVPDHTEDAMATYAIRNRVRRGESASMVTSSAPIERAVYRMIALPLPPRHRINNIPRRDVIQVAGRRGDGTVLQLLADQPDIDALTPQLRRVRMAEAVRVDATQGPTHSLHWPIAPSNSGAERPITSTF